MACLQFECSCGNAWSNNSLLRRQYCNRCGQVVLGDFDEEGDHDDDRERDEDVEGE